MPSDGESSLSPIYREALRLKAAGEADDVIAAELGVTVEAVPALLLLAERKRARAEPDSDGASDGDSGA